MSADPTRAGQRVDGTVAATLAPTTIEASPGGPPLAFSSALLRRGEGLRTGDNPSPAPGRLAVLMAALLVGLLLMGMQLWLLTVALDLYLGGQGRQIWLLALVSGAIFLGGVVMLKVLSRRPRLAGRQA